MKGAVIAQVWTGFNREGEGGGFEIITLKGWELMFLIRAFGLSEKLSIGVGFGFSDIDLTSQNL